MDNGICMGYDGFTWFYVVLCGFIWFRMVLYGFMVVLYDVMWFYGGFMMVLWWFYDGFMVVLWDFMGCTLWY